MVSLAEGKAQSVPAADGQSKLSAQRSRKRARSAGHQIEVSPETPIRVVIAEDAYVIREFLTAALGSAPEVELVAICTNGKELSSAIEAWTPDVVITDIRSVGRIAPSPSSSVAAGL